MIHLIERIVHKLFSKNKQTTVALKQYGSQASSLAVDQSDVDLAVTGLKILDSDQQISQMRKLFDYLVGMKTNML